MPTTLSLSNSDIVQATFPIAIMWEGGPMSAVLGSVDAALLASIVTLPSAYMKKTNQSSMKSIGITNDVQRAKLTTKKGRYSNAHCVIGG